VGDALRADGSIILLNMPGSSLAGYREDLGRLGAHPIDRLLPGHGAPLFSAGADAVDRAIEKLRSVDVPI
jgi:glyoxylase-like metal-dependent hydrolase (beta-lactamase superfamily II)